MAEPVKVAIAMALIKLVERKVDRKELTVEEAVAILGSIQLDLQKEQ